MVIYILGVIAALFSASYLLYSGISKKSTLWKTGRIVYIIVGLLEVYHAIVYFMVIFKVLTIVQYGAYLRPVVSLFLLAPVFIAIVHREDFWRKL